MKPIVYLCDTCEDKTCFSILSIHEVPDEGPATEYSFAKCDECNMPAIFYREDLHTPLKYDEDAYYRCWPIHERHLGFYLPKIVRLSYEEAVKSEEAKSMDSCCCYGRPNIGSCL
jgi:hypothetical protein